MFLTQTKLSPIYSKKKKNLLAYIELNLAEYLLNDWGKMTLVHMYIRQGDKWRAH